MKKTVFACITVMFSITIACGAEFQVNTNTNNVQEYPAIAMDAAGNFVVVWRSKHTGSRGTYGQRFSFDGTAIGGEFQINTGPVGGRSISGPSVAMDSPGNFVVAWTGYIGDEEHIFARRYNAGGSAITSEFAVSTDTHASYENSHIAPSVAMNASGAFAIVWRVWHGDDGHNGKWYVTGRSYNASGTAQGDEFIISQVPHGFDCDVAIDDSGDFVVAWLRSGDSDDLPTGEYIRFRRYNSDGTAKGDAVQITDDLISSADPSIAMDGSGNFAITWRDHPTDWRELDVYLQRFDPNGNPVSNPSLVNTYTTEIQGVASIAMNEQGQFVIVWHSENQDGSGYGIFGQKCDNDGMPICREFQVNTYTLDRQWFPDVATNQTGKFVAVWASNGQDGSDYGIFGEFGEFSERCCADFSGDLFVNFQDFAFLAEEWLEEGDSLQTDLINDNTIDGLDLGALCEQWLMPCY